MEYKGGRVRTNKLLDHKFLMPLVLLLGFASFSPEGTTNVGQRTSGL